MKKHLFLMFTLMMLSCSVVWAAEDKIPFDGRSWVQGFHDGNEQQTITEYVLEGQTVEKWTELVTVSEFFGIQAKTTPNQIMTGIIQMASENCNDVKKNLLQSAPDQLLFEWQTSGCKTELPGGAEPEFDLSRIIFAKDRIYMIQYASKTALTAERRAAWIKILSAAVFNGTDNFAQFEKELHDTPQK